MTGGGLGGLIRYGVVHSVRLCSDEVYLSNNNFEANIGLYLDVLYEHSCVLLNKQFYYIYNIINILLKKMNTFCNITDEYRKSFYNKIDISDYEKLQDMFYDSKDLEIKLQILLDYVFANQEKLDYDDLIKVSNLFHPLYVKYENIKIS